MARFKLCRALLCVVMSGFGGLALASELESGTSPGSSGVARVGYEMSHAVDFELGATRFPAGDSITIEEVTGTSDQMMPGNVYLIKGTYKLASKPQATLLASVTVNRSRTSGAFPHQRTQSVLVDEGEGRFSLILYMGDEGNPHVSLYPAEGGSSFANLYFGTGSSVLKRGWWE